MPTLRKKSKAPGSEGGSVLTGTAVVTGTGRCHGGTTASWEALPGDCQLLPAWPRRMPLVVLTNEAQDHCLKLPDAVLLVLP